MAATSPDADGGIYLCNKSEAAEATDYPQHVVIYGVDHYSALPAAGRRSGRRRRRGRAVGCGAEGEIQSDIINLATVDGSRRLGVVLGACGKAVEIDVVIDSAWNDSVILIRLRYAEILGVAALKTFISIQPDEGRLQRIGKDGGRFAAAGIQTVAEIEPFVCSGDTFLLDCPDEFGTGVIERQRNVGGSDCGGNALGRRILELCNQILVLGSGEPLPLGGIQEDIIAEQLEPGGGHRRNCGTGGARRRGLQKLLCPPAVLEATQMDDYAYGMGLERNEREGRTECGIEPESEWYREPEGAALGRGGKHVRLSDHFVIAIALLSGSRELRPDLEPGTGMFVNLLIADFNADRVNQEMPDAVGPIDRYRGAVGGTDIGQRGQVHFEEHRTQQLSLAGNDATDALAKIGGAVQLNWNGLYGEGGVTSIHLLEVGELGSAGEIGVLTAAGYEL